MKHFSIRALMAAIVVPALGLAALKKPDQWSAGAALLFAIAAVGIALVGAVMMRGRERAWWATFAFFCGGYLVLTFAPVLSTEIAPRLVTNTALDYVHSQFYSSMSRPPAWRFLWWQREQGLARVDRLVAEKRGIDDPELELAMKFLNQLDTQLQDAVDHRHFVRIGHALFALLSGLLGGTVAVWFYGRREPGEITSRGHRVAMSAQSVSERFTPQESREEPGNTPKPPPRSRESSEPRPT